MTWVSVFDSNKLFSLGICYEKRLRPVAGDFGRVEIPYPVINQRHLNIGCLRQFSQIFVDDYWFAWSKTIVYPRVHCSSEWDVNLDDEPAFLMANTAWLLMLLNC